MSELTQQAFVDKIAEKTFYENGENLPEDIRQFIDFSLQKGIAVTNDACANSLSEIILQHEFMFKNQSVNENWFRDELLNVRNIVNREPHTTKSRVLPVLLGDRTLLPQIRLKLR